MPDKHTNAREDYKSTKISNDQELIQSDLPLPRAKRQKILFAHDSFCEIFLTVLIFRKKKKKKNEDNSQVCYLTTVSSSAELKSLICD